MDGMGYVLSPSPTSAGELIDFLQMCIANRIYLVPLAELRRRWKESQAVWNRVVKMKRILA